MAGRVKFPWQTSRIVDEMVSLSLSLFLSLPFFLSFGMCIYGAEHVINPRPSYTFLVQFYNLDPDGRREPLYSIRVVAATSR